MLEVAAVTFDRERFELAKAERVRANLKRIIKVSPEWVLAHGKSLGNLMPDRELFRNLTDQGPLKLYHVHPDGYSAWWKFQQGCGLRGCGVKVPLEVVGRAVWLARARGKYVLGYKSWTPKASFPA